MGGEMGRRTRPFGSFEHPELGHRTRFRDPKRDPRSQKALRWDTVGHRTGFCGPKREPELRGSPFYFFATTAAAKFGSMLEMDVPW